MAKQKMVKQMIAKKRKTPRRRRPELFHGHKAVMLRGAARSARRAEVFQRAKGRCEEETEILGFTDYWKGAVTSTIVRCENKATEWSHMRHGAHKCDCLDPRCSIASCHECHIRRHNGGKPVPKKAGGQDASTNGN